MRPTTPLRRAVGVLLATIPLAGCSLVSIEFPEDPLSELEINARVSTHRFVDRFTQRVQEAADAISAAANQEAIHLNTLRWKIGSTSAISVTAFQVSPRDALVDTWIYCIQMSGFLRDGAAQELFGAQQALAIDASAELEEDVTRIARQLIPPLDLPRFEEFVFGYAERTPLTSIDALRESAVPELYEFLELSEAEAISTVGTLGQVVSDLGSRISVVGDQVPNLTAWRSELFLRRSGVDQQSLQQTLDEFGGRLERVARVAERSPQILDDAIVKLNEELAVLAAEIDRQRVSAMEALALERAALTKAFMQERVAVTESLSKERAATMREVEAYTDKVIADAFDQVKGLAAIVLVGIIALVLVLFGLPFGIGFLVGRVTKRSA